MSHRAVLDHVLALIANADCGRVLVLRGSMAMLALAGDRARDPGDLDFLVRQSLVVPPDDLHPYPFVDTMDSVQISPEVSHGAGRYRMWTFEEFDTGGLKPRLPPEGLRWVTAAELQEDTARLDESVLELIATQPVTVGGVRLDADNAAVDTEWGYAYDSEDGAGGGGSRLVIPWQGDGVNGTVRVDFAYDERLPEPPVLLAVPRIDGRPPTVTWAANARSALIWKVHWLVTDQEQHGFCQGKDLYDAVLLAELVSDPPRLPEGTDIRGWRVDTGDPGGLLQRLAVSLDAQGPS